MNVAPIEVPHPWSEDALLAKAQLYLEQMHEHSHDDWKFVLWSTLALELLARAALAHISPTLLADPKDWNNILYALEIEPKEQRFVPRSIDLSIVIDRLKKIIPDFDPELGGFAQSHIARRNQELHSGGSPLEGLGTSGWLPHFYRSCQVLLKSMDETLENCLSADATKAATEMIAASLDESAKAVKKEIAAHKTVWEHKEENERTKLIAQAAAWATKHVGHRVKCPACGSDAIVTGSAIAAPIKKIESDEITEVQQYLPSKFECIACELKVSGLPQLTASGIGDAYKATFIYDAAEYYEPEDAYAGYEPDYND